MDVNEDEFYLVRKDVVWEYIGKINTLLAPDEEGQSKLKSSGQNYCLGMLRTFDYVISNGESEIDLDRIELSKKKDK